MRRRQVHLDCHTGGDIPEMGSKFSKENFQEALKVGHVDSITVFSKCHHGWSYHPTKVGHMHPTLKFDLLKAQIEAAHEIGVKTPVYLSAGLDHRLERKHPEWLLRDKDESLGGFDFTTPMFRRVCFNSPYLDYLCNQIKEVLENYDADGIFLDIVGVRPCYCQNCINTLLERGLDPYNEENIMMLAEETHANYVKRVRETIDSVVPGGAVFHNGGHIRRGRYDLAFANSHLELESLPTGGWGYDHFPLSAAYTRTLGMEFLGMTGKFHLSWGDYGGFKHINALRYEVALSQASGAGSSIGDFNHPSGEMQMATYKLIGTAYKEAEEREPWLLGADFVSQVAVLSSEAVGNYFNDYSKNNGSVTSITPDVGCNRMLLEGKYLYDYVDVETDISKYDVLILPDDIRVDKKIKDKIDAFIKKGGKILATGKSGLYLDKDEFAFDFGAEFMGENEYNPDYYKPDFDMEGLFDGVYVMKCRGYNIKITDGKSVGERQNSYFNRTLFQFSGHSHTPNNPESSCDAVVVGKDGAYISWDIFEEYGRNGYLMHKRLVTHLIDILLGGKKVLKTNLPAQGVVTMMEQKENNRLVVNLLYAAAVKRGENVEIIEDLIPICDTEVEILTDKKIKNVYLAPQMENIAFKQDGNKVSFKVEKFENYQLVILDY